jgi:hypothetical protein
VVKTPAAIASVSERMRVRSLTPEGFNPAAIPAALNPFGAVIPPVTTCQSAIIDSVLIKFKADYINFVIPYLNMIDRF